MRFENRVAFVTGGGGPLGIGRAACLAFAREGASVVVAGGRSADAVADEVRAQGGKAIAVPLDVTVSEQVQAAVDTAVDVFKRIDILFNNAGILGSQKLFELTPEQFDRVMAVNVKGCLLCAQAVAKVMVEQEIRGRIINNSSIYAEESHVGVLSYCVSKAALNRLTRSLALELRPHGITVNAVAPGGGAPTGMNASQNIPEDNTLPDLPSAALDAPPLERGATVWDYIGAVLFLASDEAAYISGDIVTIDGGAVSRR
ncbi:MAG: SDR family oxidoreductase [Candidatus Poribacteria bacterium]|nr:SDR family oxidoreductase [Candidatus Poribacteria bacterium]